MTDVIADSARAAELRGRLADELVAEGTIVAPGVQLWFSDATTPGQARHAPDSGLGFPAEFITHPAASVLKDLRAALHLTDDVGHPGGERTALGEVSAGRDG